MKLLAKVNTKALLEAVKAVYESNSTKRIAVSLTDPFIKNTDVILIGSYNYKTDSAVISYLDNGIKVFNKEEKFIVDAKELIEKLEKALTISDKVLIYNLNDNSIAIKPESECESDNIEIVDKVYFYSSADEDVKEKIDEYINYEYYLDYKHKDKVRKKIYDITSSTGKDYVELTAYLFSTNKTVVVESVEKLIKESDFYRP